MIKQSTAVLVTLSLCLAACNRGDGNASSSSANAAAANDSAAAAPAPAGNKAAAATGVALALDGEGLRAVEEENGRTSLLPFGSPVEQAIDGLNRIFGAAPTDDGTNDECGGGGQPGTTRIVQWGNAFRILARDGKFTGWEVREPPHGTMNGIGVGSTRAQLDEAFDPSVEESTLGTEFTTGEGEDAIGGLLSAEGADGRVTSMWAGDTCHFR